jgi:hypothetical protein
VFLTERDTSKDVPEKTVEFPAEGDHSRKKFDESIAASAGRAPRRISKQRSRIIHTSTVEGLQAACRKASVQWGAQAVRNLQGGVRFLHSVCAENLGNEAASGLYQIIGKPGAGGRIIGRWPQLTTGTSSPDRTARQRE